MTLALRGAQPPQIKTAQETRSRKDGRRTNPEGAVLFKEVAGVKPGLN
jgi:hypothetical protein